MPGSREDVDPFMIVVMVVYGLCELNISSRYFPEPKVSRAGDELTVETPFGGSLPKVTPSPDMPTEQARAPVKFRIERQDTIRPTHVGDESLLGFGFGVVIMRDIFQVVLVLISLQEGMVRRLGRHCVRLGIRSMSCWGLRVQWR